MLLNEIQHLLCVHTIMCTELSLIIYLQVRKANRIGDLHEAKKLSEYTLCFSIGGIVFHIILALMVIMMFLMLHYIAGHI